MYNELDAFLASLTSCSLGDTAAQRAVTSSLAQVREPVMWLVEAALSPRGDEYDDVLATHASSRLGAEIPLVWQDYPVLFAADAHLEYPAPEAFRMSPFARDHLEAITRAPGAARTLLHDLARIRHFAVQMAVETTHLASMLRPPLHILQAQAQRRLELALGTLVGKRILEVGCDDGTLLEELAGAGAEVTGIDVILRTPHPRALEADILGPLSLPPQDGIVATAVFEHGSGFPEGKAPAVAVLERLRELLVPGGVCVFENVGAPFPFSDNDVAAAGFTRVSLPVPSAAVLPRDIVAIGARSCALRLGA
ncbi:MAG: class I SAM-dependent methyltransferase [Myxococcota bacterium]